MNETFVYILVMIVWGIMAWLARQAKAAKARQPHSSPVPHEPPDIFAVRRPVSPEVPERWAPAPRETTASPHKEVTVSAETTQPQSPPTTQARANSRKTRPSARLTMRPAEIKWAVIWAEVLRRPGGRRTPHLR